LGGKHHSPIDWRSRLILAAVHSAAHFGFSPRSANPDANARIASSVLACLDAASFDDLGLLPAPWVTRLWNTAADTQFLIDEMFAPTSRCGRSPLDWFNDLNAPPHGRRFGGGAKSS
jgi:hypothetical protein